jgi:UDP-N-acetylmuramyl tripeptide synthase
LASLAGELRRGSILVTGSAGKGTTCLLLAEVMRAAGLNPVLSVGGRGDRSAVAAMVARARSTGQLRHDPRAVGLFEVAIDALAETIGHMAAPTAVVCTNLFRSEPARGRQTPSAETLLERGIRRLPASTTLILNADDPRVAGLAPDLPNPRLYFGMSDPCQGRVRVDATADRPPCPRCSGELSYACGYYGHLGHWACGWCGFRRPQLDVSAGNLRTAGARVSRLRVSTAAGQDLLEISLPGLYNAYNALAAAAAATHAGLPRWSLAAMGQAAPGSGRMELMQVAGREVHLAIAPDARSYTEVLRAVLGEGEPRRLLLGLDDGAGTDPEPGWIWDVDFDAVAGMALGPVISGSRAASLAVRLKYACWLGDGQDHGQSAGAIIEPDAVRAFRAALTATPPGESLWVVSTPVTMHELRRWLRRHGHVRDQRRHDLELGMARLSRQSGKPSGPPLWGRRPAGRRAADRFGPRARPRRRPGGTRRWGI